VESVGALRISDRAYLEGADNEFLVGTPDAAEARQVKAAHFLKRHWLKLAVLPSSQKC